LLPSHRASLHLSARRLDDLDLCRRAAQPPDPMTATTIGETIPRPTLWRQTCSAARLLDQQ